MYMHTVNVHLAICQCSPSHNLLPDDLQHTNEVHPPMMSASSPPMMSAPMTYIPMHGVHLITVHPTRLSPLSRAPRTALRSRATAKGANAEPDETSHACRSLRSAPNPEPPERGRSGGLTPPPQAPRSRAETSATSAERRRTRPSHRATRAPVGVHTTPCLFTPST